MPSVWGLNDGSITALKSWKRFHLHWEVAVVFLLDYCLGYLNICLDIHLRQSRNVRQMIGMIYSMVFILVGSLIELHFFTSRGWDAFKEACYTSVPNVIHFRVGIFFSVCYFPLSTINCASNWAVSKTFLNWFPLCRRITPTWFLKVASFYDTPDADSKPFHFKFFFCAQKRQPWGHYDFAMGFFGGKLVFRITLGILISATCQRVDRWSAYLPKTLHSLKLTVRPWK